MTGIVGGTLTGGELSSMADSLYHEEWYETRYRESANGGVGLVEHASKDPHANALWAGENGIGVVYGVIANASELSMTVGEVFERALDRPEAILPELEGPFTLAYIDTRDGGVHVVTDKAGTRPCYYTASGEEFFFGSELKALVGFRKEPTLDPRAVGDLLSFGTVIGEKTLVESIHNLPPASHLSHVNGSVSVERYWRPTSELLPSDGYVDGWIDAYRTAMGDVNEGLDGRVGLWLSGGIDSRVAGAVLKGYRNSFETLSYHDRKGRDREIAARVAACLDVPNRAISHGTADELVAGIENCVSVTDSMINWSPFSSLSFVFGGLHGAVDVVMEGGTFLGEDVWSYDLTNRTPVETIYLKKRDMDAQAVRSLLTADVDPKHSIEKEVAESSGGDDRYRTLDTVRRLYSYGHMRNNSVHRSQVGTRAISHGDVLDRVIGMPSTHRMRTFPFTAGRIPYGVPRVKLDVIRTLDSGLQEIPYDRTRLAPSRPFALHAGGFIVSELVDRFHSKPVHALYAKRCREEPTVRRFVSRLLDDAAGRPLFETDAVETLRSDFFEERSDDLTPIAAVTGLELWRQNHLA